MDTSKYLCDAMKSRNGTRETCAQCSQILVSFLDTDWANHFQIQQSHSKASRSAQSRDISAKADCNSLHQTQTMAEHPRTPHTSDYNCLFQVGDKGLPSRLNSNVAGTSWIQLAPPSNRAFLPMPVRAR